MTIICKSPKYFTFFSCSIILMMFFVIVRGSVKSITVHCNHLESSYCFIDEHINLPAESNLYIIHPNRYFRTIDTILEIKPAKRSYIASIESIFENFPELEKLFLSNSLDEMPSLSRTVTTLKYANFRDNFIVKVPKIRGIIAIEELNLNRNAIQTIDDYAFDDLKHLHTIRMDENQLTFISNITFAEANNLRIISLRKNRITELQDGCFALKNLRELNLADNRLDVLDNSIFIGAQNMKIVNFSHNRIKFIKNGILALLQSAASIETLNLEDNQIGMFEKQSISNGLHCANDLHLNLKQLNLAKNQLSLKTILNGLKCFQNLETLNLNRNKFTQIENVVDLKFYFPHLIIVYMIDNKLKCDWLQNTIFDTSLIFTLPDRKRNVNEKNRFVENVNGIACIS